MLCSETEPCSANGYAGTVGVTRFRPFITTFFVLRKNETSRLAELNVSLTEAKNETDKAKVAHSEAEKQVERLKRDVDAAKRAETIASKQVTEVATERDRFRTAANKLETDMAKIRKAIGEIRCQEILG
jgi:chromosome segregation ATPase